MDFRDLKSDEIECRVASCKENGLSLLLYKNARCDMNLLDECIGAEDWQRDHKELKGNIYCGISIWDKNKNMWITKWDCGSESFTDKEKGEASDSFKRAGFNWGIGRELYTAPFIWIKSENCKIYDTGRLDKYNKPIYSCNDNFEVKSIEIKDKKIVSLEIKLKDKVVFSTKRLNTTETKTEIEEIDINAKVGFGKNKDLTWLELHSQNPNYFDWLIDNAKSPEGAEIYKKIREEIEKSFINIEEDDDPKDNHKYDGGN